MIAIYTLKDNEDVCYGRYTDKKYAKEMKSFLSNYGVEVDVEYGYAYSRKCEVDEQKERLKKVL